LQQARQLEEMLVETKRLRLEDSIMSKSERDYLEQICSPSLLGRIFAKLFGTSALNETIRAEIASGQSKSVYGTIEEVIDFEENVSEGPVFALGIGNASILLVGNWIYDNVRVSGTDGLDGDQPKIPRDFVIRYTPVSNIVLHAKFSGPGLQAQRQKGFRTNQALAQIQVVNVPLQQLRDHFKNS
jgi:hypothetical protein